MCFWPKFLGIHTVLSRFVFLIEHFKKYIVEFAWLSLLNSPRNTKKHAIISMKFWNNRAINTNSNRSCLKQLQFEINYWKDYMIHIAKIPSRKDLTTVSLYLSCHVQALFPSIILLKWKWCRLYVQKQCTVRKKIWGYLSCH